MISHTDAWCEWSLPFGFRWSVIMTVVMWTYKLLRNFIFWCWSCFGLGKLKGSKNCCCAKFHITPGEESPRASESNFWLQLQVTRCSKLRLNRGANNSSWKFPLSGSQVRCVRSHNLVLKTHCLSAETHKLCSKWKVCEVQSAADTSK